MTRDQIKALRELEAAKSAWEETGPESEKRIAELEAEVAALEKLSAKIAPRGKGGGK